MKLKTYVAIGRTIVALALTHSYVTDEEGFKENMGGNPLDVFVDIFRVTMTWPEPVVKGIMRYMKDNIHAKT